jgi:Protein of unknown function (DUF3168)
MTVAQTLQSEAQVAIWQALNPAGVFDSVLSGLGFSGLYDEVTEDTPYDYLSFGPTLELPFNAMGNRGYLCSVQLDIWSRQEGFKKAQAALSRCNQLIDQQPLALPTQVFVSAMLQSSAQSRDPDAFATRHIAVRYAICSQEH